MGITAIDIQQHQFKTHPFGYEKAGVDRFLELVAEEMERLARQNQEIKDELARTRNALEEMRRREATLKDTLVTAQKVTDDLKNNARKEAEIILAEAALKGERIVAEAEERRSQIAREIQDLKRARASFEVALRALAENHLRLLDTDPKELQSPREARRLDDVAPPEGTASK